MTMPLVRFVEPNITRNLLVHNKRLPHVLVSAVPSHLILEVGQLKLFRILLDFSCRILGNVLFLRPPVLARTAFSSVGSALVAINTYVMKRYELT